MMQGRTMSYPARSLSPSMEFVFPLACMVTVFGFIAGVAIAGVVIPAVVQIAVPAVVRVVTGA